MIKLFFFPMQIESREQKTPLEKPCRETYHEIAEQMDIETLKSKCAVSFKRFFDDVQQI